MSIRNLLKELADICDDKHINPIKMDVKYMGGDHLTGTPALIVEITDKSFRKVFANKSVHAKLEDGKVQLFETSDSGRIHFHCTTDFPNTMHVTQTGFTIGESPTVGRDAKGRFMGRGA